MAPKSYLFSGRSTPAAGGVLFSDRRMGLCRLMRSHYHDWIDYRTGKLSMELLEWNRKIFGILGEGNFGKKDLKIGRLAV